MYLIKYENPTLLGVITVVKECDTMSALEETLKEVPVPINKVSIYEVIPRDVKLDIRLKNIPQEACV